MNEYIVIGHGLYKKNSDIFPEAIVPPETQIHFPIPPGVCLPQYKTNQVLNELKFIGKVARSKQKYYDLVLGLHTNNTKFSRRIDGTGVYRKTTDARTGIVKYVRVSKPSGEMMLSELLQGLGKGRYTILTCRTIFKGYIEPSQHTEKNKPKRWREPRYQTVNMSGVKEYRQNTNKNKSYHVNNNVVKMFEKLNTTYANITKLPSSS
jgi:hypothetical protein